MQEYGADLDAVSPKGWTPLSYSRAKGKYGATEEKGIYPEVCTYEAAVNAILATCFMESYSSHFGFSCPPHAELLLLTMCRIKICRASEGRWAPVRGPALTAFYEGLRKLSGITCAGCAEALRCHKVRQRANRAGGALPTAELQPSSARLPA